MALLPQGTMNFYGVTAGLPGVEELAALALSSTTRRASIMQVSDSGSLSSIAFEAMHIGLSACLITKNAWT